MCSSNPIRSVVEPVAEWTGTDAITKGVTGKSFTDTVAPKIKPLSPYKEAGRKHLAIGTSAGGGQGLRKPLGSKSGLNN